MKYLNRLLLATLTFMSLVSAEQLMAEIKGDWVFKYESQGVMEADNNITLTQSGESVFGSGVEILNSTSAFVSGNLDGTSIFLVGTYSDSIYQRYMNGQLLSETLMSGEWEDNSGGAGTWNASQVSEGSSLVTPGTKLVAPQVSVLSSTKATLRLQPFSGVGTLNNKGLVSSRAKTKDAFRYVVEVRRLKDQSGKSIKKDITKLTSKKNQLTLKSLKGGSYSAKYKIEITRRQNGVDKVVGKTAFSPATSFEIKP